MKKLDLRKKEDKDTRKLLNKIDYNKEKISQRREDSRRNILEIMKGDFKSAFTNPIVIIVLLGVIILPSMYALVNIYACWNPYEETSNVQFAIANEDQGATYQNYTVNAGNDLVSSLSNNTDFNWQFVSSSELRRGVHNGTYYAGIVIPQDFSQSIVSITTDNPHTATLEYIVNQKSNPVAGKLTDAASKSVFNRLNSEIVSFVNVAAYDKLGQLQAGLSEGAYKMRDGADQLSAGADKVASGAGELENGAIKVSNGADQLASGSSQLESGARALSTGATQLSVGANQLSGGADQVARGSSQVADGTQQVVDKSKDMYITYSKLKQALYNATDTTQLQNELSQLDSQSSQLAKELRQLDNQSSSVSKDALNLSSGADNLSDDASMLVARSNDISNKTHQISNQFDNVSMHISQLNQAVKNNEKQENIRQLLNQIDQELNDSNQQFNTLNVGAHQVANASGSVSMGAAQLANGTNQLVAGSNELESGAGELTDGAYELSSGVHVLSNGTLELAAGAELLGYSSASALENASNEIGSAANQLSNVTTLSDNQVEDYFMGPVRLQRYEEFPANNYGSQVAPFYIVLSMWVGALINTVMLKTGTSIGTKYKPHEMYLGKLLIFNIMAILQTTVTLIGCYILGIDIYNPPVFTATCYFVSLIFMILIYSLISLLGEVGKGISILLLVFQISGSGGIYPIEIMSNIFGFLYPYLPMTHAINVVRESQLGLLWNNYIPSFIYLVILGIVVIVASVLLKQKWDKRTKYFEDKLEKSGLFN